MIRLLIIAFSVYPDHKSSEGIVNNNWIQILKKNEFLFDEISLKNNTLNKKLTTSFSKCILNYIYSLSQLKVVFGKLVYRLINKVFMKLWKSKTNVFNYFWVKSVVNTLKKNIDKSTIVWSRVLPVTSLEPVINFYKEKAFPFIVNINDPIIATKIDGNNDPFTREEKMVVATKDIAQCWTFPSTKLADSISDRFNLDRERCFVIPHAMSEVVNLYKKDTTKKKINFLYTGTFYKSAFTDEFKRALIAFNENSLSSKVHFTFVLSQYDQNSINWLKETIPNLTLLFKLNREKVLDIIKASDCMFVVDAKTHLDLLKGKLVEAISYGIPVFAPTYKDSVMDRVVREYGGVSSYHDVKGDILSKLINLTNSLNDEVWLSNFYKNRVEVLSKISEQKNYDASIAIVKFAYNRFNNIDEEINSIKVHSLCNWP